MLNTLCRITCTLKLPGTEVHISETRFCSCCNFCLIAQIPDIKVSSLPQLLFTNKVKINKWIQEATRQKDLSDCLHNCTTTNTREHASEDVNYPWAWVHQPTEDWQNATTSATNTWILTKQKTIIPLLMVKQQKQRLCNSWHKDDS